MNGPPIPEIRNGWTIHTRRRARQAAARRCWCGRARSDSVAGEVQGRAEAAGQVSGAAELGRAERRVLAGEVQVRAEVRGSSWSGPSADAAGPTSRRRAPLPQVSSATDAPCEPAVVTGSPSSSSVKSLVAPARSVTRCSTSPNADAGPGAGRSAGGSRLGVPDCSASWTTMPWASFGCRNASFQKAFDRSTPTGSMPSARALGQRLAEVGDEEREVVRPGAARGQEALEERSVGPGGRGQQLDLRARAEAELAPPVARGVAAVDPAAAEQAAEQLPAVSERACADRDVIEDDRPHERSLASRAPSECVNRSVPNLTASSLVGRAGRSAILPRADCRGAVRPWRPGGRRPRLHALVGHSARG